MREAQRVRAACTAIASAAPNMQQPLSVKCRLGVDDMDSFEEFAAFVDEVARGGGTRHFVVHARRCLTRGLSPKDNRTVPPLRYHWVQRVALRFPHLSFGINGGITDLRSAAALLLLRRAAPAAASQPLPLPSLQPPLWRNADAAECSDADDGGGVSCGASSTACGYADEVPCAVETTDAASLPPTAEGLPPPGNAAAQRTLGADGFPLDPWQQLEPGVVRGPPFPPPGTPLIGPPAGAATSRGAQRSSFDGHPAPGATFASVTALRAAGGGGLLSSVMIGRAAYTTPWMLADADRLIFGVPNPGLSRREVVAAYLAYATQQLPAEVPAEERAALPSVYATHVLMRPLLNLFHGCAGGALFRAQLSSAVNERKLGLAEAVAVAMSNAGLSDDVLDERPPAG